MGILGVNLLYGCFHFHRNPRKLVNSIIEGLSKDQVQVDMIKVSGPAFEDVDNRVMSVHLVQNDMTNVVMIGSDGRVGQPSDLLYKKNALILRGRFRPFTLAHADMIHTGTTEFLKEEGVCQDNLLIIGEISTNNLISPDGNLDVADFVARADIFAALGYCTMISNFQEYYRIADYCANRTKRLNGLILSSVHLQKVFDEKYYKHLPGGLLEACGVLFNRLTKLYVYPTLVPDSPQPITCANLPLDGKLQKLFQHFYENGWMRDLQHYNPEVLGIQTTEVLQMIKDGDKKWESRVPPPAASLIKSRNLFRSSTDL